MSGKLDQSLDEIMKDRKPAAGRRRAGRPPARKVAGKAKAATATVAATTGGIRKKASNKAALVPTKAPVPASGGSKIAVSNLPLDADEKVIKEFFEDTIGKVKQVICTYGPDGRFRGMATVSFVKPTAAAEATRFDETELEGKRWRVEVLVGAKNVAKPPPPKSLQERITKPKTTTKNKPKPVAKPVTNGEANGAAKSGRPRANKKSGRAGKPKAKTADELDAEMKDYFGGGQANGATTAAGGDTGMDDVE